MKIALVVAGDHRQFIEWCYEHDMRMRNGHVICNSSGYYDRIIEISEPIRSLQGVSFRRNDIVVYGVGTYDERGDWNDLVMTLHGCGWDGTFE